MPSQGSKRPLAPPFEPHTFLRKSTGESPLPKTTRAFVPVEVRTSQSIKFREQFVGHLRLLYPQLSNAADKSYLEMIKEIPFQNDLENSVVELKFQSELSKIVKHYDSLTIAEEAEAVKILMGKINIPTVLNWISIFNEMATGCDVPIPVSTVDDFRFVLMACFENDRRAKARTAFCRYGVSGTPENHRGTIKAVSFKEKIQANPTKSGNKTPSVTKADEFKCQ